MNICEMVALADKDGKTYESKFGWYSKNQGFGLNLGFREWNRELINEITHDNSWQLKKEKKKMTKEEIEKELGYEIEIIGGSDESKNKKEDLSNLEEQLHRQFVNALFGVRQK